MGLAGVCHNALAITGAPRWPSAEQPGFDERLAFLDESATGGEPVWALVQVPSDAAFDEPGPSAIDDYLPVDPALARDLICASLRAWLLEGGWQVQVTMQKGSQRWRLVDGLSFADGGGDRLDDDYPYGDDELAVLCESVVTLAEHPPRVRGRGPG